MVFEGDFAVFLRTMFRPRSGHLRISSHASEADRTWPEEDPKNVRRTSEQIRSAPEEIRRISEQLRRTSEEIRTMSEERQEKYGTANSYKEDKNS